MAGLLGRSNGRASTDVVGLAACICGVGLLACATQHADPPSLASTTQDSREASSAPDASSAEPEPPVASAAPPASGASASASASASVAASAAASSTVAAAGSPVSIEVGEPRFTSGDVANARTALERLSKKFKACIDDNGGLTGARGELELSFLVRAAGKAEGADVAKVKGIGDAAKKCVQDALKKKAIGTPSDDPIGVTVVLKLTASK